MICTAVIRLTECTQTWDIRLARGAPTLIVKNDQIRTFPSIIYSYTFFRISRRYITESDRVTWREIASFRDYKNCEYNMCHVLFMGEDDVV